MRLTYLLIILHSYTPIRPASVWETASGDCVNRIKEKKKRELVWSWSICFSCAIFSSLYLTSTDEINEQPNVISPLTSLTRAIFKKNKKNKTPPTQKNESWWLLVFVSSFVTQSRQMFPFWWGINVVQPDGWLLPWHSLHPSAHSRHSHIHCHRRMVFSLSSNRSHLQLCEMKSKRHNEIEMQWNSFVSNEASRGDENPWADPCSLSQVLMKDINTPVPPDEMRKLVQKCLEKAALVNYSQLTEYAQIEGLSPSCPNPHLWCLCLLDTKSFSCCHIQYIQ